MGVCERVIIVGVGVEVVIANGWDDADVAVVRVIVAARQAC